MQLYRVLEVHPDDGYLHIVKPGTLVMVSGIDPTQRHPGYVSCYFTVVNGKTIPTPRDRFFYAVKLEEVKHAQIQNP